MGADPLSTTAHQWKDMRGQECSLDQRDAVAEVRLRERDGRTKLASKLAIWQALWKTSYILLTPGPQGTSTCLPWKRHEGLPGQQDQPRACQLPAHPLWYPGFHSLGKSA